MRGELPQKTLRIFEEIQRRDRRGMEYTPHQESLDRITGAIMVVCGHLLNRNVDPDLLDPSGTMGKMIPTTKEDDLKADPLTVLTLREIQLQVASKRQVEYMKVLTKYYEEIIAFHNDMVMKIHQKGSTLSAFFPDDNAGKISKNIRFLHSITGYGANYGRLTPKQVSTSLESANEYKGIVEIILGQNEELQEILKEDLERKKGDEVMARTEICLHLNDKQIGRGARVQRNMICNFHYLNSILIEMDKDRICCDPRRAQTDSFISFTESGRLLSTYIKMDEAERTELKEKIIKNVSNSPMLESDKMKVIAERFFEILEQYI